MTKQEEMLALADEIEAATVPIPFDLMLMKNERALICETLRATARSFDSTKREEAAHLVEDLIQAHHDYEMNGKRSNRADYEAIKIRVIDALCFDSTDGPPERFVPVELLNTERMVTDFLREENAKLRVALSAGPSTSRLPVITKGLVPDPNSASGFSVTSTEGNTHD